MKEQESPTLEEGRSTVLTNMPCRHTITVYQREDGTKLDKLLLSADPGYVPTGLGD